MSQAASYMVTQARGGVGLDQGSRWPDSGFTLKVDRQDLWTDWVEARRGAGQEWSSHINQNI